MNKTLKLAVGVLTLTVSGLTAQAAPTIYGLVATSESENYPMGIYKFEPSEDLQLTAVQLADDDHVFDCNDGAVYHDGKFETKQMMAHKTFDTNSWTMLHECSLGYPIWMEMSAKALAWDSKTDKIYGCFMAPFTMDHPMMSYLLGTVDYETNTVTAIRDLETQDIWTDALFTTPAGDLYGVLNSGMLVKINTTDGSFTEIGDTGMKPAGYQGSVVDPTTGIAYWALSTEETSGVYELDLTDGSVVLLAEFPDKVQLTGLYITGGSPVVTPPALDGDVMIYGLMATTSSDNYPTGIYKFSPEEGTGYTLVQAADDDHVFDCNDGAVYHDGKFETKQMMAHKTFDTNSWTMLHECSLGYPIWMEMSAKALVWDSKNDKIYGCFMAPYTMDHPMMSYLIGTVDYETNTVTAIRDLETQDIWTDALFATPAGDIYGVLNSGMLVKINTTDGSFTEIGDTGMKPAGYQGSAVDPVSGKAYWALSTEETAGLYELDLTDGSVILITEFPAGSQFTGLYVVTNAPAGDIEAPALATDVTLNFTAAQKTGTLSFTAPTLSNNGTELAHEMNYSVTMDGEEIATGTVAPGAIATTEEFSVAASGSYLFGVTLSNAAGSSAVAYKRQYIGHAKPENVTEASLAISGNTANVSWKAPIYGLGDGYFNKNDLTYDVVRYPGEVLVAEKIAANSFSEDLDAENLNAYYYGITAYNGDTPGDEVTTNIVRHGAAAALPYFENFEDPSAFELYTVIDGNGDGNVWEVNTWVPKVQYYAGMSSEGADDWMVTPAFRLEKNKIYELSFLGSGSSNFFTQHLTVSFGTAASAKDLNKQLLDLQLTEIPETENAIFTVDNDGLYYIGFYTDANTGSGIVDITDISLKAIASIEGPAATSDLKVVPGENGALNANISFTSPAKTYEGTNLASLTKIELTRDDEVIKTWDSPAIGSKLSFEDSQILTGMHRYTVVGYNDKGAGYPAVENIYIGLDIPAPVENIALIEKDGKAVVTWTAPAKGSHGGYVDPSALTYSVQRSDGTTVAAGLTEPKFEEELPAVNDQYDLAYAIMAVNLQGYSTVAVSPIIIIGPDYTLPFEESFAGANTDHYWGISSSGSAMFQLTNIFAQDSDGGSVIYQGNGPESEASIISGRIDFSGAEHPGIELYAALNEGAADFEVIIHTKDGKSRIAAGYVLDRPGVIYHLALPLFDFADEESVRIELKAKSDSRTSLFVDAISVRDDETMNVEMIDTADVKAYTLPGMIVIEGAEGLEVTVANLEGKLVASRLGSIRTELPVNPGFYLVKIADRTFKLLVK